MSGAEGGGPFDRILIFFFVSPSFFFFLWAWVLYKFTILFVCSQAFPRSLFPILYLQSGPDLVLSVHVMSCHEMR